MTDLITKEKEQCAAVNFQGKAEDGRQYKFSNVVAPVRGYSGRLAVDGGGRYGTWHQNRGRGRAEDQPGTPIPRSPASTAKRRVQFAVVRRQGSVASKGPNENAFVESVVSSSRQGEHRQIEQWAKAAWKAVSTLETGAIKEAIRGRSSSSAALQCSAE